MIKKTLIALCILLTTSTLHADTFENPSKLLERKISKKMKNCYDTSPQATQVECPIKEEKLWDRALNDVYKRLGGNKNIELKKSQRAWIKFRDANEKFISKQLSHQGSAWSAIKASEMMEITKQRVLYLEDVINYDE